MARSSRKSHEEPVEKAKRKKEKTERPFVVYASYKPKGEEHLPPRWLVLNFETAEHAAAHVAHLIGNDDYEWAKWISGDDYIITSKGISIRLASNRMVEVLDTEVDPDDYAKSIYIPPFLYGPSEFVPKQSHNDDTGEGEDRPRRKREAREPKEPKVKIDKTGLISANDIAKKLGVEGREVRGVLRAMKLEKPQGGWLFDKKTAEEIEEKVKKGLKKK